MKKPLLTLSCILSAVFTLAQAPKLDWAKKFGGAYDDLGHSIVADASGNVYTTGSFRDSFDFDPGTTRFTMTSLGEADIFISKLDANGKFVWAKKIGGIKTEAGYAIALDGNGNIYITGGFQGTVDFDPGTGVKSLTAGGTLMDIFVAKFDPSGNFGWAKSIGGTLTDYGSSIAVDASGNVYTTGFFYATVDFDPDAPVVNLSSSGNSDVFILKLDATGKFAWAKNIGSSSADAARSISVDGSGNVYTTGSFTGTADFDPGLTESKLTSAGGTDIFISKLNNSGNFVWAKNMGGSSDEEGSSIVVNGSGISYTLGRFADTADLDPGTGSTNLTSLGDKDIFILKLDASGKFSWVKQIGGLLTDLGLSIAIDATENIYTTGSFKGTVDFDPGTGKTELTSLGLEDIFISKLNAAGNLVWAKKIGGTLNEAGQSIAVTNSGTVYLSGFFSGTVDFDPDAPKLELTSEGLSDIFVHKMGLCAVIDVTTTLTGTNIKANNTTATYQWVDCNKGFKMIAGENKQTFAAKVNGSYAVIVSVGVCADTSTCTQISTIGINETFHTNISIYPNPTSGIINLESGIKNEGDLRIQILNSIGQIVMEENSIHHSQFNIQHLPKGLYFLKVIGPDGIIASERIMKF